MIYYLRIKMKGHFPLFQSPIDLAHHLWKLLIRPGDGAIDATCGNGHDTLFLARICKEVISLDIQQRAIEMAQMKLENLNLKNVQFHLMSHETFPSVSFPIRLIVYNLGYLPGGDKNLTTLADTTLKSLQEALILLEPGGMISITCYPGHPEGAREEEALLACTERLEKGNFSVSYHTWKNRDLSPSLILIQKKQC